MKKSPELIVIETDANGISSRRKPDSRGAKLKQSILTDFEIDDPAGAELLEQICIAIDRLDTVTARIAADGVMVKGQRGQRAHPLLKIEARLRGFVVRSLGKLGIAT